MNVKEFLGALTTFLTMSYIIFVNPNILAMTGMDVHAVFVATCLVSALGCFLLGLLTNYPIAIAPGMALNVYFTFVVVQKLGMHWQDALGAVFIAGVLFLIISISSPRHWLLAAIPDTLNIAITAGLALFIALIAFKNAGIVTPDMKGFFTLSHLGIEQILFFSGFMLTLICYYYKIPGAILIGILVTTLLSFIFENRTYQGIIALPPSLSPTFLQMNFHALLNMKGITVIFSFLFVTLFDCTGTLIGLLHDLKLLKKPDTQARISKALFSDSIATLCGALLGTSSTSPYLESATGIKSGARTGLSSIFIAGFFILALFLSPLASTVPNFATAPALLFVACMMLKSVREINWGDFTEMVPSLLTMLIIPFTLSIANGIGVGIISHTLIKLFCRQWAALNPMLIILSLLFIVFFTLQTLY